MMKKILSVLAVLAILVSFSACSMQNIAESIGEQKNKAVTRGVIEGNLYSSEYAELSFEKPSSWEYSTDDEIAELMNLSSDVLERDAFEQAAATIVTVYDMMVIDPTTNDNINVAYENLKLTGNTSITEDEFIDTFEEQYLSIESFDVTIGERATVTLGTHVYTRASLTTTYNNVEMNQYVYARKIGDYMHVISVTLVQNDSIESIEAMFS